MTKDELKVGMFTKEDGLIIEIHPEGNLQPRWEGKAHILYLDYHDPYYGPCLRNLREGETYNLLYEQGTPEYKNAISELITTMMQYVTDQQKFILEVMQYL